LPNPISTACTVFFNGSNDVVALRQELTAQVRVTGTGNKGIDLSPNDAAYNYDLPTLSLLRQLPSLFDENDKKWLGCEPRMVPRTSDKHDCQVRVGWDVG